MHFSDLRPIIANGEANWASRAAMKRDTPSLVSVQRSKELAGVAEQASKLGHFGMTSRDVLGVQAFTGVQDLSKLAPDTLLAARDRARATARTSVALINKGGMGAGDTAMLTELQARGANVTVLDSTRMRVRNGELQYREGERGTPWHKIETPEAAIARGTRTNLIQPLEDLGVHMVNPSKLRPITLDKGIQADVFQANGVAHPTTIKGLHSLDDVQQALADLPKGPNGEFVVKKVNGAGGQATWVVRDEAQLQEIAAKHFPAGTTDHDMLVQQYLDVGSADFRGTAIRDVHGDLQLRSVHHRQGQGTDGLANGPQGSKYTRIPMRDVDPEIKRLTLAAAESLGKSEGTRGLDHAGVDIVKASDGKHYVLEINGTAGIAELDVPLPRGGRAGATHGEHNLPYMADWLVWGNATN